LKRVAEMPKPIAPEDKSITTVYIGNVGESITEKHLTDYFYQFGEIRSVNLIPKQNCAFVTYTTREATEAAIDKSFQKLTINGQKLIIKWGKSQAKKGTTNEGEEKTSIKLAPVPGLPIGGSDYFNLSSNSQASLSMPSASASTSSFPLIHYPSQDPNQMGSYALK